MSDSGGGVGSEEGRDSVGFDKPDGKWHMLHSSACVDPWWLFVVVLGRE